MKKSELKNLIREEVIHTLSDVLPSLLAEAMVIQQETGMNTPAVETPQKKKPVNEGNTQSFKDLLGFSDVDESQQSNSNGQIRYTDNPILNEVLNSTHGGVPQNMLPPAYQMAEAQEQHSLLAEMGQIEEPPVNDNVSREFESKMAQFAPTPPNRPPAVSQEQQPQGMSEAEEIAYAESFGADSGPVVGEIPMEFINTFGKKAGAVVKESTKRSNNKGFSNIDFSA